MDILEQISDEAVTNGMAPNPLKQTFVLLLLCESGFVRGGGSTGYSPSRI